MKRFLSHQIGNSRKRLALKERIKCPIFVSLYLQSVQEQVLSATGQRRTGSTVYIQRVTMRWERGKTSFPGNKTHGLSRDVDRVWRYDGNGATGKFHKQGAPISFFLFLSLSLPEKSL